MQGDPTTRETLFKLRRQIESGQLRLNDDEKGTVKSLQTIFPQYSEGTLDAVVVMHSQHLNALPDSLLPLSMEFLLEEGADGYLEDLLRLSCASGIGITSGSTQRETKLLTSEFRHGDIVQSTDFDFKTITNSSADLMSHKQTSCSSLPGASASTCDTSLGSREPDGEKNVSPSHSLSCESDAGKNVSLSHSLTCESASLTLSAASAALVSHRLSSGLDKDVRINDKLENLVSPAASELDSVDLLRTRGPSAVDTVSSVINSDRLSKHLKSPSSVHDFDDDDDFDNFDLESALRTGLPSCEKEEATKQELWRSNDSKTSSESNSLIECDDSSHDSLPDVDFLPKLHTQVNQNKCDLVKVNSSPVKEAKLVAQSSPVKEAKLVQSSPMKETKLIVQSSPVREAKLKVESSPVREAKLIVQTKTTEKPCSASSSTDVTCDDNGLHSLQNTYLPHKHTMKTKVKLDKLSNSASNLTGTPRCCLFDCGHGLTESVRKTSNTCTNKTDRHPVPAGDRQDWSVPSWENLPTLSPPKRKHQNTPVYSTTSLSQSGRLHSLPDIGVLDVYSSQIKASTVKYLGKNSQNYSKSTPNFIETPLNRFKTCSDQNGNISFLTQSSSNAYRAKMCAKGNEKCRTSSPSATVTTGSSLPDTKTSLGKKLNDLPTLVQDLVSSEDKANASTDCMTPRPAANRSIHQKRAVHQITPNYMDMPSTSTSTVAQNGQQTVQRGTGVHVKTKADSSHPLTMKISSHKIDTNLPQANQGLNPAQPPSFTPHSVSNNNVNSALPPNLSFTAYRQHQKCVPTCEPQLRSVLTGDTVPLPGPVTGNLAQTDKQQKNMQSGVVCANKPVSSLQKPVLQEPKFVVRKADPKPLLQAPKLNIQQGETVIRPAVQANVDQSGPDIRVLPGDEANVGQLVAERQQFQQVVETGIVNKQHEPHHHHHHHNPEPVRADPPTIVLDDSQEDPVEIVGAVAADQVVIAEDVVHIENLAQPSGSGLGAGPVAPAKHPGLAFGVQNVMEVFPGADRDYVTKLLEGLLLRNNTLDQALNMAMDHLLENPPPVQPLPQPNEVTVVHVEKSILVGTDFYKNYDSLCSYSFAKAADRLSMEFTNVRMDTITTVLKRYNGHFAPAYRCISQALEEAKIQFEQQFKPAGSPCVPAYPRMTSILLKFNEEGSKEDGLFCQLMKGKRGFCQRKMDVHDPDLKAEVEFVKRRSKLDKEEQDRQVALTLLQSEYDEEGQSIECGCCYMEQPFESLVQCFEGHLFCCKCLEQYAREAIFGSGKLNLSCMTSECESAFPKSQLLKALPTDIMHKYEERMVEENLNKADMQDLVRCPSCNMAVVLDFGIQVFKCPNSVCRKEMCRDCKEDWSAHRGKRCDQVEKKDETNIRTKYEEKMTEARVRRCAYCKAQFFKEEGCNRMTCRCGATMCYICRQPKISYEHFCRHPRDPGRDCTQCKACSLWSNPEEDEKRAIAEIQKEAQEKRKAEGYLDDRLIGAPEEPATKKSRPR